MYRYILAIVVLICAAPAAAQISGPLRVIDGDTFDVGGTRVRLYGIDAPEIGQPCADPTSGDTLDCGTWVAHAVAEAFGGQTATCAAYNKDLYGRTIARCQIGDIDLGDALVRAGFALAYVRYSEVYVMAQKQASVLRRGLWALQMARPEDYRAGI